MGSKSTQSTQIPEYIEEAGKLALQRAQEVQAMGYVPYMGPEVATINPYEQAAAANVGGMASAFGMQAPTGLDMGGMPTVTQGGITGYSSYPAYLSAMERLREQRPDQYEYLSGMGRFDPITGAVNPNYNMPVMEGETASNMPVVSPSSGGGNDDAPSHAEIMQMHYGIKPAGNVSGLMDTKGQIGKYSGSMQGMSPTDKIKSDLGYAKATVKKDVGKLFGGLFGG